MMSQRARAVVTTLALFTFAQFCMALAIVTSHRRDVTSTVAIALYLVVMVGVCAAAGVAVDTKD